MKKKYLLKNNNLIVVLEYIIFCNGFRLLVAGRISIKKPPCMGGFVLYSFEKGISIVQYISVQSHYREYQLVRL